jgi:anti-sigma B factor antagonist
MKIISNNLESGELLVKIEGEVDVYTSIDLKKELTRLIEVNQKKIIIDLENVNYMDSLGLGVERDLSFKPTKLSSIKNAS